MSNRQEYVYFTFLSLVLILEFTKKKKMKKGTYVCPYRRGRSNVYLFIAVSLLRIEHIQEVSHARKTKSRVNYLICFFFKINK